MNKPHFDWGESFERFLQQLPEKDEIRVIKQIKMIESRGLKAAIQKKQVKKLEKNLYEIRAISSENSIRIIYFQVLANDYYITHGFTKKTNQTPRKEIEKGKRIRTYILRRRNL